MDSDLDSNFSMTTLLIKIGFVWIWIRTARIQIQGARIRTQIYPDLLITALDQCLYLLVVHSLIIP